MTPLRLRGVVGLHRVLALVLTLVGVPAALSLSVFLMDAPIRAEKRSPRTVVAPDLIRVPDPAATDRARRAAAARVQPVLVEDPAARAAIVQRVRDAFDAVRGAREPDAQGRRATPAEQATALAEPLNTLSISAIRRLVTMPDDVLEATAAESLEVARQVARRRMRIEQIDEVGERTLETEISVSTLPPPVAQSIVAPLIRASLQPTVRLDDGATDEARQEAAAQVTEVTHSFPAGSVIVSTGEMVDDIELAALQARGLQGTEPWRDVLRAFALALAAAAVVAAYIRAYRVTVWRSTRKLLLLALLFFTFALLLEGVSLTAPGSSSVWRYAVPVGAVAMLATMLLDPPIGALSTIPVTALVAFETSGESGVVVFAALASLVSVPLVSRLSARGDLRRAAWQSTLAYAVLAATLAAIFDGRDAVPWAAAAATAGGVVTAMLVATSVPYLESLFGVITATGLLDLADRNHPLLRELEQKALGSYNHSIMVATMCERACRAIGADPLLASVAALYHDIGKVRRPWFFVENQFGIANPHDELEPAVSAVIIQEHVTDGLTMAKSYRLPPEVVEGIATHHGTTLVSYFYRQALQEASDAELVDDAHYRYKGRKPASREMAVLMLADCCEGASRAAAQHNRNLSQAELEVIVRTLIAERVDDGQLDESALTFRDLSVITQSFIETLVGVYHPRIPYPPKPDVAQGVRPLPKPRSTHAEEPRIPTESP